MIVYHDYMIRQLSLGMLSQERKSRGKLQTCKLKFRFQRFYASICQKARLRAGWSDLGWSGQGLDKDTVGRNCFMADHV